MPFLLKEKNIISLRTADVHDDGNLVDFRLRPADYGALMPKDRTRLAPKDFDWTRRDHVWLYRHMRSDDDEVSLMRGFPCLEQDLRPLKFGKPPEFKLLWTGSGHSVALYLNQEPWAFINEETHEGYSKGILRPTSGEGFPNLWDQRTFEKIFLEG